MIHRLLSVVVEKGSTVADLVDLIQIVCGNDDRHVFFEHTVDQQTANHVLVVLVQPL